MEATVQQAEAEWRQGNFSAAFRIYQGLLFQRLAPGRGAALLAERLTAADMVVIERLVDLAVLLDQFQAADDLLAGMIALNEQAGNRRGADYIRLKRIHLTLGRGLLKKAYSHLEEMAPSLGDLRAIAFTPSGLQAWEERVWVDTEAAEREVLLSRLYLMMGWVLASLGQYRNALAALERGLLHTGENAPDLAQQATVPLELLIASALLEKGDLARARQVLGAIEPFLDALRQPGLAVRWLELSGKLNLMRGNLGEALAQFQQVLELCRERGFHQAALGAMLNLAHILILVNQTRAAENCLRTAQQLGDASTAGRAAFLLEVARARGHSLADSVPIAPSVLEMWEIEDSPLTAPHAPEQTNPLDLPQPDNYLAFFEDRALGFYWYLGRRDWESAAAILRQMREIFVDADSDLVHLRLHVMDGVLAYYQDLWQEAAAKLDKMCAHLRALELKPELWQAQRILGWCWAKLQRASNEQQALATETTALLDEITNSLAAPDQAIFRLNKWTADEEYLAGEIDQLAEIKKHCRWWRPFLRWSLWRRLQALIAHLDRYKDVLAQHAVSGQAGNIKKENASISVWHRLFKHPRCRATIAFLVLPDRTLMVYARRFAFDFGVSPITRLQVRDFVRRWHELARGDANLSFDPWDEQKAVTEHLANQLQIPAVLQKLPRRIRALTIVPDDSLHGFPFAAIFYQGQYLIERYALSRAFEFDSRPATAATVHREALLVGVAKGAGNLPPLPGTSDELDQIEQWLKLQRVAITRFDEAVNKPATKAGVLANLLQAGFFHIACHGIFHPNQPDQSGLVLIPDSGQSEIISLRDLAETNLSGLQHATLSSCWSADNFVLPGRWIISLPETLWRAGAQSILGSLWPVSDALAVAFMTNFYNYLAKLPRDQALQRAQLDCLHRNFPGYDDIDTALPIHWAGFNLYGDHRPLHG